MLKIAKNYKTEVLGSKLDKICENLVIGCFDCYCSFIFDVFRYIFDMFLCSLFSMSIVFVVLKQEFDHVIPLSFEARGKEGLFLVSQERNVD